MKRLREWWDGVRRVDVLVIRHGETYDAEMRIRHGPCGIFLAAIMSKQEQQWCDFGAELRHLIEECSEGGTMRVPPIHIVFGEELSPKTGTGKAT